MKKTINITDITKVRFGDIPKEAEQCAIRINDDERP